MRRSLAVTLGLAIATAPVLAGGPRLLDGGSPVVWPTSDPVSYQIDPGPLGTLSNAQAAALVREAFDTLEAVETASITFRMTGVLPADVNSFNWALFFGIPNDGRSPIVFDDDGRILDEILGLTARNDVEGAVILEDNTGTVLEEASLLINGACFDGVSGTNSASPCELKNLDEMRALILHEIGHFVNLDHADLNRQFAKDGRVSNNASLPTMYPVQTEDDAQLVSLHFDDKLALSNLYPAPGFFDTTGRIEGTISQPSVTPLDGANVILRSTEDPYLVAASTVSGDLGSPGAFAFDGVPPGTYTLEARPVWPGFVFASSVGQTSQDGTVVTFEGPGEYYGPSSCMGGMRDKLPCDDAGDCPGGFCEFTEDSNNPRDHLDRRDVLRVVDGTTHLTGMDIVLNDVNTVPDDNAGAGNDSFFTATQLRPGGDTVGDRIVFGDVDYYRVFLPDGWRMRIDVEAADDFGSTLEPIVAIFDPSGADVTISAVGSVDPWTGEAGLDPYLEYSAPPPLIPGDHRVAISSVGDPDFDGIGGTTEGSYFMRVHVLGPFGGEPRLLSGGGGVSDNSPALPRTILSGTIPASLGGTAQNGGATIFTEPILPPAPPVDTDGDGIGNEFDPCPNSADTDGDGVCDEIDNCDATVNADQRDGDANGIGDVCDDPSVIRTYPPDGQFGVPLAAAVEVRFSEEMNVATVGAGVRIVDAVLVEVPSSKTVSTDGRTVTIDPTASLTAGVDYTIQVDGTVQDTDANGVTFAGATFRTTPSTDAPGIPDDEIGTSVEGSTTTGVLTGDRYGAALDSAGDVDGDGISDYLVGAPMADGGATESGVVYLYLDHPDRVEGGGPAPVEFHGVATGDEVGASLAFVGDVSGDGIGDFLVGAPGVSSNTGYAYLVFGREDMQSVSSPVDLDTIDDAKCDPCGVIIRGERTGDRAGAAVSYAGDFNRDGKLDILLAAPDALVDLGPSDMRPGAGIIYLIFGSSALETPGPLDLADVGTSVPGVVFLGENEFDAAGTAVSGFPDHETDGQDDLVIGSPYANVLDGGAVEQADAGIVHVIQGQTLVSPVDLRDVAASVQGVVLLGEEPNDHAGFAVSGEHDVTGDGETDLLIGAPGMSFSGRTSVGAGILIPSELLDEARDPIKKRVGGVICLGRLSADDGGPGGPEPDSPLLRQAAGVNIVDEFDAVVFMGEGTGDEAGASIRGAGDLNGDGVEDILIGAPQIDLDVDGDLTVECNDMPGDPECDVGRVYLILSQVVRSPGEVGLEGVGTETAGLVFDGTTGFEELGTAVAGAGDVDSTNFTEVLLGAPGDIANPPNSGTVYITVPIISAEAGPVELSGAPTTTIEWTAPPGAVTSRVYRGTLSVLLAAEIVETSSAVCLTPGGAGIGDADFDGRPDTTDANVPALGDANWYLASGSNALGEGPLGTDSSGELRKNDTPCP